jgi:hypothetical protein
MTENNISLICGVEFHKKNTGFGPAPQGERVRTIVRSLAAVNEAEARERCWRIFKRDHPAENMMAWEIAALIYTDP